MFGSNQPQLFAVVPSVGDLGCVYRIAPLVDVHILKCGFSNHDRGGLKVVQRKGAAHNGMPIIDTYVIVMGNASLFVSDGDHLLGHHDITQQAAVFGRTLKHHLTSIKIRARLDGHFIGRVVTVVVVAISNETRVVYNGEAERVAVFV